MSRFKLGLLIGGGVGLLGAAAVAIWLLRDPIPPLSREAYSAAVARWNAKSVHSYDMQAVFSGGQPGEYDVEVRDGKVTRLVRDGEPLPDRGVARKYWTIPGMFEILEMDLARLEQSAQNAAGAELRISAEFDEDWGYPRRYRQIQLEGKQVTSEWQITRFSPAVGGDIGKRSD